MIRLAPRLLCRLAAACSLFASAGCCTPDLEVDPQLILGSGEVEFEFLDDGAAEVELINGIQGGWHVWASVRATGLDWSELRLDFTLSEVAGDPVTQPSRTLAEFSCCAGAAADCEGFGEIVGYPVLVDEPAIAVGRHLTLRVEASDPDGRNASAERDIVPFR